MGQSILTKFQSPNSCYNLAIVIERITGKSIDAGGRLTVKSALNPMLWFCAVVDIPIIVIMTIVHNTVPPWLLIGFFVLICIPIVTLVFSAIYLLFKDRDKLQSEDYQIRKRTLDIIGQKGDPATLLISQTEAIANPELAGRDVTNTRKKKGSGK